MKTKKPNIGISVSEPKIKTTEKKCPFYGNLRVRGRIFIGTVTSDRAQKTVTVEWKKKKFIKKYQRYSYSKVKVHAHNPESMNAKTGDVVRIAETRPLSKTKNFTVIEIMNRGK